MKVNNVITHENESHENGRDLSFAFECVTVISVYIPLLLLWTETNVNHQLSKG